MQQSQSEWNKTTWRETQSCDYHVTMHVIIKCSLNPFPPPLVVGQMKEKELRDLLSFLPWSSKGGKRKA